MKALIVEDEKLAAERLTELIKEIDPGIEIVDVLTSVESSVKWLRNNKPDLIFLDIQLEDGICFSIFEEVSIDVPVIFTTAYDQYAIKAFKLNSIDYLLKPVRKDELRESIGKYKNIRSSLMMDFGEILNSIQSREISYKKRFLIQYGNKIKSVNTSEIAFFYALEKNVYLCTFSGNTYPLDFSLDKIQEIVDPDKYFRINRKIIINAEAIKNMVPYSRSRIKIELEPKQPKEIDALVSVERSADFKNWLDR